MIIEDDAENGRIRRVPKGDVETPFGPSSGTTEDLPSASSDILSTDCRNLSETVRALLDVAESIGSCRELEELFRRLASDLRRVVSFDFLGLVLHEPEGGIVKPQVLETT